MCHRRGDGVYRVTHTAQVQKVRQIAIQPFGVAFRRFDQIDSVGIVQEIDDVLADHRGHIHRASGGQSRLHFGRYLL